MQYEALPPVSKKWLADLEHLISEWEWRSQQMPEAQTELASGERLASSLEVSAELSTDELRQHEALLSTFKSQVESNLADARSAESDFVRRHELQAYGRHGAIPSPFFARRLAEMHAEVSALRARLKELDGAVESRRRPALTPEAVQAVLTRQKDLFDRSAQRLQAQHALVEAHRRDVRTLLRRDPFAESREREASTLDKYKPAEANLTLPNQLPTPNAAAQTPGGAATPAPGLGLLGGPAATPGANPFGATPAAGANPFAMPKPAGTPFGALGCSTPAAATPGGGLFGAAATTPAAGATPFGALGGLGAPVAPAAGGGLFGAPPAGGGLFGAPAAPGGQQRTATGKKKQTGKR